MKMTLQPTIAGVEDLANVQIQSVEMQIHNCSIGSGDWQDLPNGQVLTGVSMQVELLVSGFNRLNLPAGTVSRLLPQAKTLRDVMDCCLVEIKSHRHWLYRFLNHKAVSRFESAADRLDSLVETWEIGQDVRFYDFIREATKETVA